MEAHAFATGVDCVVCHVHPRRPPAPPSLLHAAMAAGRPVVVLGQADGAETLRDGENGFLAQSEDELVAVIARLQHDAALRARIGAAAAATIGELLGAGYAERAAAALLG